MFIFVCMLSFNNFVEDREVGVLVFWCYFVVGVDKVKEIVMFLGCLNFVVVFLFFEREVIVEVVVGLFCNIFVIEEYR